MKTFLLGMLGAMVFTVALNVPKAYAQAMARGADVDVLAIVGEAGSLTRAQQDVFGNAFVASNRAPDGAAGGDFLAASERGCVKFGPGTQEKICASANNVLTANAGLFRVSTYSFEAATCPPGQSCYTYVDPGAWHRYFPSSDTSGCGAGTAGGIRFRSTDGRLVNCDGTAVRPLSREVDGALQLPTSATADLPAAAPAGRILYDTDAHCVKATDGTTWSCL